MRSSFILSELGVGLRRNVTMTVSVVLTVTLSLLLVGVGLLTRDQINVMKGYWYDKIEVTVYLCGASSSTPSCVGKDVTSAQRTQLLNDLQGTPLVQRVYYESREQAFAHFKEQFKDSPDLVANVSPDALPGRCGSSSRTRRSTRWWPVSTGTGRGWTRCRTRRSCSTTSSGSSTD